MKTEKKVSKNHIKIGDKIKVIAGDQKGFLGNVLSISKKDSSVILDGLLPRVRFMKNSQGGDPKKVEIPLSIHVSNVMLWDKEANKADRIGMKEIDGQKKRYFKKSGHILQ
jgi:large subunit ribosomal protein L24